MRSVAYMYTATIDPAIAKAILCRWGDATFSHFSCYAYRNALVIGQFIKRCPA